MVHRYQTGPRMSQAAAAAGLLFTAGQVAKGENARAQTEQILAAIDALLAEAGTSKEHLVSASIWLTDVENDFAAMNEVWDAWVLPGCTPARATVGAALASPEYKVEIAVVAAIPGKA
jgi:enamine deaminase RidA (YjgF/YER057c/UK114 family)